MSVCGNCLKEVNEELISTDHFRGEAIRHYCEDCFYEGVKTAFNDSNLVCNCGEKMVLEINDKEEIIELVHIGEAIFYRCQKVAAAKLTRNFVLVEELEKTHDNVGLYAIQPEGDC